MNTVDTVLKFRGQALRNDYEHLCSSSEESAPLSKGGLQVCFRYFLCCGAFAAFSLVLKMLKLSPLVQSSLLS